MLEQKDDKINQLFEKEKRNNQELQAKIALIGNL